MSILVTGAAGFIGFHLCHKLIQEGHELIGIDNVNDYYDQRLKFSRLNLLKTASAAEHQGTFEFIKCNISDSTALSSVFAKHNPTVVVNLAAQAGVRYSIHNPSAYIESNITGFANILECCRHFNVRNLLYASSSSVYGGNEKYPFSENDSVDHPVSLYAATKKSNELMAHSYSHLYNIPTTGLRFFTVYGPWGRPDMALFLFTKAILEGKPIDIFNNGNMTRDFTYIDDLVQALVILIQKPATSSDRFNRSSPLSAVSWSPYRIFNVGNSSPVTLISYIEELERCLGITAKKNFLPMQPGDVSYTSSDTSLLSEWISFTPSTPIDVGIQNFVDWYKSFYS